MNIQRLRSLFVMALALGLMTLWAAPAQAHAPCTPFSGTIYFWLTDTWHGAGNFTIGRTVLHAQLVAVNTSFLDGDDTWQGTEKWTFDFGKGNTVHLKTHFVTQHMTDSVSAAGVFDLIEVGTFAKGTGMFKRAYGNLGAQGPFGPGVKLPDNIHPAPEAQWFAVVPSVGMICGLEDRDDKD